MAAPIHTFDILSARNEIRRHALASRDQLRDEERGELSRRLLRNLAHHLNTLQASYLHCYISFRSEVETREFIEEILERGLRVVVPIVETLDGEQFLIHTEIKGLRELQRGAFGLEEPVERPPAALEGLDAVILPLAAFDRTGNRLGYGKGFYDRFLSSLPREVERIGLAFALQEAPSIPSMEHDARLDVVITEREIIHCQL